MRTPWKRVVVGLLIAGAVGGAALGLAQPGDPPAVIPHADDHPDTVVPVSGTTPPVRNDPSVSIEWSGPAVVKANQPTEWTLTVRNVCGQSLQKVVLQVRAPKGTEITAVKPEVKPIDGVFLWEFGTLDAKATKSVTVTLKQPAKGDMTCQAWVTLTGTSVMKAVVKEPKLAVTIKAPEKVAVGDKFTVEYTVKNVGDLTAEGVNTLSPHTQEGPVFSRLRFASESVTLEPGESQTWKDTMIANPSAGPQPCRVRALAADGLSDSAETTVQVLAPKLDVSVSGPKERLIGTKGRYTVKVTNSGEVPVSGVTLSEVVPAGFKVCDAGAATLSGDRLQWSVDDLTPGKSVTFAFEGATHTAGQLTHKVEAAGDRNTKASGECVTQVEGIPGLRMELVDSVDPVEKGGELTYEIKVTNTGTKADSNIVIACHLPKELEYVSVSGPTANVALGFSSPLAGAKPTSVTFDPITDLAPKTEAVFKVKVKGVGTGDVRFKAVMTSKHLTAPVTKEESTRVYGE